MLPDKPNSLWQSLKIRSDLTGRCVIGAGRRASWSSLLAGSCLSGQGEALRAKSVLVATTDQLASIAALVELDGIASRLVLYPPDLPLEQLPYTARCAGAEAIVSDRISTEDLRLEGVSVIPWRWEAEASTSHRDPALQTEWILLTSGTTGLPKLVSHTLESLSGAIVRSATQTEEIVWSTFYDVRRYGGLQILLRAALTGTSLVLSDAQESTADFLARAGAQAITHISGTPSQWRRALMSTSAHLIQPIYIRLSGEIADQGILDQLHSFYPQARISHAFASTEAGVAFEVKDGLTGFASEILHQTPGVDMKVENGSLRIRSQRTASRYLNDGTRALKDDDGFVDTGDSLALRAGRYHFVGRGDGVINVGGLKVHPEEVEEVINRHPDVRMSLVRKKKSPITGALVIADVVLKVAQRTQDSGAGALQQEILSFCRKALAAHKVPVSINFVPGLAVAETGKLIRNHA